MLRSPQIRRRLALPAVLAVLIALPAGIMVAGTQTFTDVPPSHPFYADIEALAASGVTSGCTATTYCPNNNVTRAQMAAFLNRLGALQAGKTPVANAATARSTDGWSLGCPSNTVSSQGLCFDNATRGSGTIYAASDACATIGTAFPLFGGHRWFLPGANQLRSAAAVAGLNVSAAEWSSDMWIDSDDGWTGLVVWDFLGAKVVSANAGDDTNAYRCATHPVSWDGITLIFPRDQGGPVGLDPASDAAVRAQMDLQVK